MGIEYELGTTEEYLVVSTKKRIRPGLDRENAVLSNLELLGREFPKLNIKQVGTVIIIYRFKVDSHGQGLGEYEVETAYPIGSGKLVSVDPRTKLAVRELKRARCARYRFKGPIGEAPWDELKQAVAEKEKKRIEEIREVYHIFKGREDRENVIELQVILR